MSFSSQTQRSIKLFTAIATVGVGIQSVVFSNYDHVEGFEGKEHIFSHVQGDIRDWIDRNVYNIDITNTATTTTTNNHTTSTHNNDNNTSTRHNVSSPAPEGIDSGDRS